MKRNISYLFPLLLLFATGCFKSNTNPNPVVLPSGTFSGPFVVIHLNSLTGKQDTSTANVILTMSLTTGYSVTGDTSTLQAGSKGSYVADGQYISFTDQTLPAGTTVVKPPNVKKNHLNGLYQYVYDGTNFQFYSTSADTIGYTYVLKKN